MSIFASLKQWMKKPAPRFAVPGFPGFTLPLPALGLWYSGLWPMERTLSTKIYIFFTVFAVVATSSGEMLYCMQVWGDIGTMSGLISTIIVGMRVTFICVHFFWRNDELTQIIKKLSSEIWISREEDEKAYLTSEKKTIFLNWVSAAILLSMTSKFFVPYLTSLHLGPEGKRFPFPVHFPFSYRDPGTYEIVYCMGAHAGWACVLCIISHDSLLSYTLIYTCAQLQRLSQRIMDIGAQDVEDNTVAEALAGAVEEHNRLIEFVDQVEDLFSPNILFQFVVTSLLICVLGIQILLVPAALATVIETALFFIAGLGQLYGICYSGQELIDCSNKVGEAAYSFNWIDVNKKFHMTVIMIIQRSQNPLEITAYKLFNLSMESFSSICSTAGSYFALLKQLMEDKSG